MTSAVVLLDGLYLPRTLYSLERLNLRRAAVNMTGDGHYPLPVPCGARRGALEGETARGAARCARSTARRGAKASSASAPVHARSLALGLGVSNLDGLAASAGHRGAGDRYRVAPSRPPPVLDVEEPSPHGSTTCPAGGPRSNSHHVAANPLWGAPRIHGELLKVGIDVSQATVAKYMIRHRRPPSHTWKTFLANHVGQIIAADFFVVPTVTCRLLFVLVILAHERRRVVHIAVTDQPIAAWTAQQLREAFPWGSAPPYLLRDRDQAFTDWSQTAKAMDIHELVTAPRSPWQNAYVERFIGSVRRECLDHVIVCSQTGLRRTLQAYSEYYQRSRTHLALDKDAPVSRRIADPTEGAIVAVPQLGGLHQRYERRAA